MLNIVSSRNSISPEITIQRTWKTLDLAGQYMTSKALRYEYDGKHLKHCFFHETAFPLRLKYVDKTDRLSFSKPLDLAGQNKLLKDLG